MATTEAEVEVYELDPSSHANINEIVTQHISLDFKVDFEKKSLTDSTVTLKMKAVKDDVKNVVLDSYRIKVNQVFI
jgi:leukotriene-A4 hydrolase